jgi:hypothetical protein
MKSKINIFKHPLFGTISGLLIVICGFLFQFYYQRKVAREDTQTKDITLLKTQHLLDSVKFVDFNKRLEKLERPHKFNKK